MANRTKENLRRLVELIDELEINDSAALYAGALRYWALAEIGQLVVAYRD